MSAPPSRASRWPRDARAAGGAAVAVGVAVLASPLMPLGLARIAEPDPGFATDWLVLGVGAAPSFLLSRR